MHRAIGRALRGTCRKWRDNECPVAAGEEVRKGKKGEEENNKNDHFVPPKHSWEEAVTWTTGLVLGYQFTHHRRHRQILFGEKVPTRSTEDEGCKLESPEASLKSTSASACPFAVSSKVFTQPIFSHSGTSLNVKSRNRNTSAVIQSIDITPFIPDYAQELEDSGRERLNSVTEDEDEDDIIFAEEPSSEELDLAVEDATNSILRPSSSSASLSSLDGPAEFGRQVGGDLLSILGAFEFLQAESSAKAAAAETKTGRKSGKKKNQKNGVFGKDPPVHALDLMKRGSELGSSRALYNIGVAYDRMKDMKLAKEYYKRAADLGHPLAIYNCAVLALKEGHLTEGYALMKTASDYGVPEAKTFLTPADESLAPQMKNLEVGNA